MIAESWLVLRFPKGMDMNWALDVQSAQTLDFYAGMHGGKVAWDLGTLTGISAAVLSAHMKKVTRRTDVSGRMVLLSTLIRTDPLPLFSALFAFTERSKLRVALVMGIGKAILPILTASSVGVLMQVLL